MTTCRQMLQKGFIHRHQTLQMKYTRSYYDIYLNMFNLNWFKRTALIQCVFQQPS
jgi:hypothetical protein